jgi:hypothetical protein
MSKETILYTKARYNKPSKNLQVEEIKYEVDAAKLITH